LTEGHQLRLDTPEHEGRVIQVQMAGVG